MPEMMLLDDKLYSINLNENLRNYVTKLTIY